MNPADDDLMILSPLAITRAAGPGHEYYFAFYIGLDDAVYSKTITPAHGAVPAVVSAATRVSRVIGNVSLGATPGGLPGSASLFAMTTLHGTKTLVTYTQTAASPLVDAVTAAEALVIFLKLQHKRRLVIEAEFKAILSGCKLDQEKMLAIYTAAMLALTIAIENSSLSREKNSIAISAHIKAVEETCDSYKALIAAIAALDAARDGRQADTVANQWTQLQPIKTDARVFSTDKNLPDSLPHKSG